MPRPLLLLDVDGVLIRDDQLLKHVTHNVNRYVSKKLPTVKNPERVNKMLYAKYGHTGRGLSTAFRLDTSDFNASVYDKNLMSHLWDVLSSEEFQEDAADIHSLTEHWDVRLFSNAPAMWTIPVAAAISDRVQTSERFYLKPDPRAYVTFPARRRKVFVDDSVQNIQTAETMHNWTTIHFGTTVNSIWELGMFLTSKH